MEAQVQHLQSAETRLRTRFEEQLAALQADSDKLQRELDSALTEAQRLAAERSAHQMASEQLLQEQTRRVKSELEEATSLRVTELEQRNTVLQHEVAALQSALEDAQAARKDALQVECRFCRVYIVFCFSLCQCVPQRELSLTSQVTQLGDQTASLRSTVAKLEARLADEASRHLERSHTERSESSTTLALLQSHEQQLTSELSFVRQRLAAAETEVVELRSTNKLFEDEIARLRQDAAEVHKVAVQAQERERVAALELTTQRERALERETLHAELTLARQQLAERQREVSRLNSQLTDSERHLSDTRRQLDRLQVELAATLKRFEVADSERLQLAQDLQIAETASRTKSARMLELEGAKGDLESRVHELSHQLQQATAVSSLIPCCS